MSRLSLVVPVYNMESSVETCVRSLMQQTGDIEILLVDDGSKDQSLAVCRKLAEEDPRIRVYHTENHGSGPARNYGIAHATGRYVYFPDADDLLAPGAAGMMVRTIEDAGADLLVFGYRSLDEAGHEVLHKQYPRTTVTGPEARADYSDYVNATRPLGIQGAPWNKLFDLELIRRYSIEYPPLRRRQDDGFIARYMHHVHKIVFLDETLYTHHVNSLQKVWDKYPPDYADIVVQLYGIKEQTILSWNARDRKTHDLVNCEYINGVIKAMELSFSPKLKLKSAKARRQRMTRITQATKLRHMKLPPGLGRYQKLVASLIQDKHPRTAYQVMKLKVMLEKHGLLRFLK